MKNRLRRFMTLCFSLALFGASAASSQRILAETPTEPDRTMGAVFDTPYRHTLQSDYAAIRQSDLSEWTDTVWQNDVLDAKVTVWAGSQPLEQVEIRCDDFSSGNHRISAENVDIRWLRETLANIGSGDPEAPVIAYPDVIHQGEPASIEAQKLKSAWISLTIPRDTAPGVYTGTLNVTSANHSPVQLTLTFEVLDLTAPDPQAGATQVELWQHPYTTARYYGVTPFSDAHKNYLLDQLREYAQMGGRGVIATIVEEAWNHQSYDSDPSMIHWTQTADGTFSFDYTDFDQWIELAIEAGVLDPQTGQGQIKAYSIAPWGNIVTVVDEASGTSRRLTLTPGSDEWQAAWTAFLEDFLRHTVEKGWFDLTYISMDEREMEVLQPCVELIKGIRSEAGKSFKIASAMNYSDLDDDAFLDRIDDISVSLINVKDKSDAMRKLALHRQEQGLLTTLYTCTGQYPSAYTISDMADTAWTMWYTMKQGTDGFLRWSWDGWVEDPLTDVSYRTFEPGDPWLIYPAERDSVGDHFYESPRYKMLKQGIRDINKAKLLQSLSAESEAAVDQLVQSLKRPKMKIDRYGSATYARNSDRELVQSEVLRMRKGIDEIAKAYLQARVVPITGMESGASIILRVGKTSEIAIEPLPYNANPVTWRYHSNDETIATVDETGLISAKNPGTTTILVQCEENDQIEKEISLIVLDPSQAPRKRTSVSADLKLRIQKILQAAAAAESHP